MADLVTRAGMTTATAGTGTVTLGSALGAVAINTASWQSFASAGVINAEIVSYLILDANGAWEVGTGTYTSAGTTLSRTAKFSSNANAAINLSGSAQVFVVPLASDGRDFLCGLTNPMRGFDMPVNLQLNASVSSNILTIAVKGNNGSDPGVFNPVLIPFRDSTVASGDPVWRAVTAALSIDTNATGATLGTANSLPFRFWVVAFDNGGTVVLALFQSMTGGSVPTAVASLMEGAVASSTAISGSATAAATFYTPNGTTVTSKSFRIIGYLEYASGLATAGTYASVPTTIQLFGPGIKTPGDTVQCKFASENSGSNTTSSTYINAGASVSISPTSAANIIRVRAQANAVQTNANGSQALVKLMRGGTGGTKFGGVAIVDQTFGAGALLCPSILIGYDAPGTTSSTTYQAALASGDNTNSVVYGNVTLTPCTTIEAEEIMV